MNINFYICSLISTIYISWAMTSNLIHISIFSLPLLVDSIQMKRMPKPMPSTESPATSPEMGRRRYNYYNSSTNTPHSHQHSIHNSHMLNNNINNNNTFGRPPSGQSSRFSGSRYVHMSNFGLYLQSLNYPIYSNNNRFAHRSSHEIGRGYQQQRGLYLELERERGCNEGSPPSDNVMFDNNCYATTPSSSNGNSDQDQPQYGSRSNNRHSHHHQVREFLYFWHFKIINLLFSISRINQMSHPHRVRLHLDSYLSMKCICVIPWLRAWMLNHTVYIHLKHYCHKVWKI